MRRLPTVLVLVAADLRGFRNRMRRMESRRLFLLCCAVPLLGAAVLAPAVTLGVSLAPLGRDATTGVLTLGFTSLGMVMLVVGLSSVMVSFFASRDLLLLAGAPIRLIDIYLARLVVAARASVLVAALLLAALSGYGVAIGAGIGYWVAAPAMVVCVVFGATALQVSLLSAIVRVVPVGRARTMVSVVAALLGSAFWLAWLLLRSQDALGGGDDSSLAQTAAGAAGLGERLVWLPTAWPARALAGIANGDASAPLWAVTTLLTTFALVAMGHAVFVQAFRRGLSALGEVPRRSAAAERSRTRLAIAPRAGAAPRRSQLVALVVKEWQVMRRDSRRLAALVPLCVIAAVYPLVGPGAGGPHEGEFWASVVRGGSLSLMLPFFFTQMLAAPAVALEGRAFMLLRLAPLEVGTVLRAKVIAVAVPMTAATTVACVILGVSRGGDPFQVLVLVLTGTWLALGATAIGVSGGAIGARFEAEDPRRAVTTGAALGSTVASLGFLGLSLGAAVQVARATGIVSRLPSFGGAGQGAAMITAFVAVAIAVGIVMLMLSMAERRLARWQPDGGRAPVVVPTPQWGPAAR
jgi:ABC-2 type transport system permease protein